MHSSPGPASPAVVAQVGARLRALRMDAGLSARALAAQLGISPSAMSQIERGVLQPSVSRLIAITDALGVPLSVVFDEEPDDRAEHAAGPPTSAFALQRADQSSTVLLETGVTFRRLAPGDTPGIEYFESVYAPHAAAHIDEELFRHEGYEVGMVISGELTIDFEREKVVLRAGDSITFSCSSPHRMFNTSDEPAVARWLIVHPLR